MSFFGNKVRGDVLKALIPALNSTLSLAGFNQIDAGEWERNSKWKIEEIDLRLREVTRRGLQPAFRVAIPRLDSSPVGDKYRYLAETKLPRILDSSAPVDA